MKTIGGYDSFILAISFSCLHKGSIYADRKMKAGKKGLGEGKEIL